MGWSYYSIETNFYSPPVFCVGGRRESSEDLTHKTKTICMDRHHTEEMFKLNNVVVLSLFSVSIWVRLTELVKFPCTSPSVYSSAFSPETKVMRSSTVRPFMMAWYLWMTDQRQCSKINRRTSLKRESEKRGSTFGKNIYSLCCWAWDGRLNTDLMSVQTVLEEVWKCTESVKSKTIKYADKQSLSVS